MKSSNGMYTVDHGRAREIDRQLHFFCDFDCIKFDLKLSRRTVTILHLTDKSEPQYPHLSLIMISHNISDVSS